MESFTLKLDIEIIKLLLVTLALLILYKYRRIFETSLSPSLVKKGAYVTMVFWLGFLADVMNDVHPTGLTKILDDIIISFALVLGTYYLIDHMRRAKMEIEPSKVLNGEPVLESGAYILPNGSVEKALKLASGKKVIALTRNPEPFKKLGIPYLWLSKVEGENAIDPLRLPAILHHLIQNADRDTVMIIDGLEYLILENGFDPVVRFLTTLKDNILLKGATLIVVVDPKTLDPSQLALLKREFKEVSGKR
ncbi:hypothetical protein A3L09_08965 [Thermococcus profundus]|uniref:DUF835 domain-containing protein n=1 Tax=Thermococcus profundus TaxID=49899 RepID=A0A2Z2MCY5_THEPR|nr:DUF835 domain-containing protein [Thermococcus profundus]ASJ03379.1 hypothetical protein A3L09_08965 [Thermococcus profundus]